jgi:hypothetical protein
VVPCGATGAREPQAAGTDKGAKVILERAPWDPLSKDCGDLRDGCTVINLRHSRFNCIEIRTGNRPSHKRPLLARI